MRHDGHFFPVWFFTAFGFEGRVTATKAIWREIALVSKNFHVKTNSSFGDTKTYGYFRPKEYNLTILRLFLHKGHSKKSY